MQSQKCVPFEDEHKMKMKHNVTKRPHTNNLNHRDSKTIALINDFLAHAIFNISITTIDVNFQKKAMKIKFHKSQNYKIALF